MNGEKMSLTVPSCVFPQKKCEFPYKIRSLKLSLSVGKHGSDEVIVDEPFASLPQGDQVIGDELKLGTVEKIEKIGGYFFVHVMKRNEPDAGPWLFCYKEQYCTVVACDV